MDYEHEVFSSWRYRKLDAGPITSSLYCLLSLFLISSASGALAEPMLAQAIIMTNSQYGVSRRLGTVLFTQTGYGGPVRVTGELTFEKLTSADVIGMHVHAFGNLTHGCDSTGPHFNPTGQKHGSPTDAVRHVGDLGNVKVDNEKCIIDITDYKIQLTGPHSILGRSLVIHMNADDLGRGGNEESSVTGNVGRPRGCGIIGVASDFSVIPTSGTASAGLAGSAPAHHRAESFLCTLAMVVCLLRSVRTVFP